MPTPHHSGCLLSMSAESKLAGQFAGPALRELVGESVSDINAYPVDLLSAKHEFGETDAFT